MVTLKRVQSVKTTLHNIIQTDIDLSTMVKTLFGEARGETYAGKVAVAWVIRNRFETRHRRCNSITAVCMSPMQFSCWNKSDPNLRMLIELKIPSYVGPERESLDECVEACLDVLNDMRMRDPTIGSRHYCTVAAYSRTYWARDKTPVARIGNHVFFNDID